jgi:hypothetical protein
MKKIEYKDISYKSLNETFQNYGGIELILEPKQLRRARTVLEIAAASFFPRTKASFLQDLFMATKFLYAQSTIMILNRKLSLLPLFFVLNEPICSINEDGNLIFARKRAKRK